MIATNDPSTEPSITSDAPAPAPHPACPFDEGRGPLGWAPERPRRIPAGCVEVSYVDRHGLPRAGFMTEARALDVIGYGARVSRIRHPDGRTERPSHPAEPAPAASARPIEGNEPCACPA